MRDPLSNVRIRYKLPLGFLVICLVAFGVGGVVLTSEARSALEEQIGYRLDERAAAVQVVVERHLDLHKRRTEDFASDGFIRAELTRLIQAEEAGQAAAAQRVREALERHLQENKLPIVEAFVAAALYDTEGRARLITPAGASGDGAASLRGETSVSDLEGATPAHPYPTFRITTPLWHQARQERIGALQLVLRADAWVAGMRELGRLPPMRLETLRLRAATGEALDLRAESVAEASPRHPGAVFGYATPVVGTDWVLELEVDRERALAPATRLRNQYILIGLVLLLLTAGVLFFPVRFLLQPLGTIAEAARRIGRGDFSARVRHESGDEIGDLARAFDIMADAVEDQTGRLREAAETVQRREQEIRIERDRLTAVIHSMKDGLFILDAAGAVTLSNAAAEPILAALAPPEPEQAAGRLECRHAGEPDAPGCLACLAPAEGGHEACVVEHGGRIFEIRSTTLPARPGTQPRRLCVGRDVTERITAQETQAHQERMTVLGEVAAVMAHELNNPLAAISMFSQMLESDLEKDSPLRASAEVIRRNVRNCKQTISSLLDLAARGAIETAPVDLPALLHDVARFLAPIYERAGLTLGVHAGAGDGSVLGDELQLRQVFINLVMNAVQASSRGGHIAIDLEDLGERIEVRVRDQGSGIPAAVRGRIFEPFFTTKGAGVGTGLGLPTSRRVVGEHGGDLSLVESGPQGTTFAVSLPRKAARLDWEAQARRSAPLRRLPGPAGPGGNGREES